MSEIKTTADVSVNIPIAKTISIRAAGYDEFCLQKQIVENASALELGDLEVISREKLQSSGGRLDILLKDPEDDTMYEVEVMLGETDETHIIRAIEYWDNEKRQWPQRQHKAVLIAETITRRFFNVIQTFSHAIPIVAIQASLIDAAGQKTLHFSKILDTYEEPEELSAEAQHEEYNEAYWRDYAEWTLDAAKAFLQVITPVFPTASIKYVKYYIAIEVNGYNYMWLHKRGGSKSLLQIWYTDKLLPQATQELDQATVSYSKMKQVLRITTDAAAIKSSSTLMLTLAELSKQSWES